MSKPHKLDQQAEAVVPHLAPLLSKERAKLTCDPYLRLNNAKLLTSVDLFVENFLGLVQGPWHHCRHIRGKTFHALDKVFWPLNR